MSARIPVLRRRPARVIPSILVSVAILILVGVLVWAFAAYLSDGAWPEPVAAGAAMVMETPLAHPAVLTAGIVLGLLGLVLLLCAVIPGRYRSSPLHIDEHLYPGSQESVLTHHGLANIVRTRTAHLDGVDAVRAEVTERRVDLNVRTPLRQTSQITGRVQDAAQSIIGDIPFHLPPTVRVRAGRSRR